MENYKNCYVAFLDILGFRELIHTSTFNQIFDIFQTITASSDYKIALRRAVEKDGSGPEDLLAYNYALDGIKIYTMSDSIVISSEKDSSFALEALIDVCIFVQNMLYGFASPVLLRGAVAVGDFYCQQSIAFGKGMVDAYIYQENYSKYPRIILSKSLVEDLQDATYKERKLYCDEDGYYHIECLKEYLDGKNNDSEECVKFQNLISKYLDGYYDAKLREKYQWLEDEYNRVVNHLTMHDRIGIADFI